MNINSYSLRGRLLRQNDVMTERRDLGARGEGTQFTSAPRPASGTLLPLLGPQFPPVQKVSESHFHYMYVYIYKSVSACFIITVRLLAVVFHISHFTV